MSWTELWTIVKLDCVNVLETQIDKRRREVCLRHIK